MAAGRRGTPEQETRGVSHDSGTSVNRNGNNRDAEKAARNLAMVLIDRFKKLSGSPVESGLDNVDKCLQIFLDYSLSSSQKLKLLHNVLQRDKKVLC